MAGIGNFVKSLNSKDLSLDVRLSKNADKNGNRLLIVKGTGKPQDVSVAASVNFLHATVGLGASLKLTSPGAFGIAVFLVGPNGVVQYQPKRSFFDFETKFTSTISIGTAPLINKAVNVISQVISGGPTKTGLQAKLSATITGKVDLKSENTGKFPAGSEWD